MRLKNQKVSLCQILKDSYNFEALMKGLDQSNNKTVLLIHSAIPDSQRIQIVYPKDHLFFLLSTDHSLNEESTHQHSLIPKNDQFFVLPYIAFSTNQPDSF